MIPDIFETLRGSSTQKSIQTKGTLFAHEAPCGTRL